MGFLSLTYLLPHRPMKEMPMFWHLVWWAEFGSLPISSKQVLRNWISGQRVGPPFGSSYLLSCCTKRGIILSLQWYQWWIFFRTSQNVGPFFIFQRCELIAHYHSEFTRVIEHFSNTYFVILLLWSVRPHALTTCLSGIWCFFLGKPLHALGMVWFCPSRLLQTLPHTPLFIWMFSFKFVKS